MIEATVISITYAKVIDAIIGTHHFDHFVVVFILFSFVVF